MEQYKYKQTAEIAEIFEKCGLKFKCVSKRDSEALAAGFQVANGPTVMAYTIVRDEKGPVSFRVFDIFTNIREDRRSRVLEACNILNCRMRYMKYTLDNENAVQISYDIPPLYDGGDAGDFAVSMFTGLMRVMDSHYAFLIKAIHSEEPLEEEDLEETGDSEGKRRLPAARPDTGMLS